MPPTIVSNRGTGPVHGAVEATERAWRRGREKNRRERERERERDLIPPADSHSRQGNPRHSDVPTLRRSGTQHLAFAHGCTMTSGRCASDLPGPTETDDASYNSSYNSHSHRYHSHSHCQCCSVFLRLRRHRDDHRLGDGARSQWNLSADTLSEMVPRSPTMQGHRRGASYTNFAFQYLHIHRNRP